MYFLPSKLKLVWKLYTFSSPWRASWEGALWPVCPTWFLSMWSFTAWCLAPKKTVFIYSCWWWSRHRSAGQGHGLLTAIPSSSNVTSQQPMRNGDRSWTPSPFSGAWVGSSEKHLPPPRFVYSTLIHCVKKASRDTHWKLLVWLQRRPNSTRLSHGHGDWCWLQKGPLWSLEIPTTAPKQVR